MGERKKACDSCHRRKILCDGAMPQCNWCKHHSLSCTFTRDGGVRKKAAKSAPRGGTHNDLAQRMDRLEQVLEAARQVRARSQQARNGDSPNSTATLARMSADSGSETARGPKGAGRERPHNMGAASASAASPAGPVARVSGFTFGKIHFAGFCLGEISSYNGIPFFSSSGQQWIRSRTGENASFDSLFAVGPLWQRTPAGTLAFPQPSPVVELPERATVEHCLAIFRASPFGMAFPIVDPVLFRHTIDVAYGATPNDPSLLDPPSAKACIFAFISVVSLFQMEAQSLPPVDGDAYAEATHKLLPEVMPSLSIATLETVFMLALYHLFSGHLQSGSMFHTQASRILFMLGAHTENSSTDFVRNGDDTEASADGQKQDEAAFRVKKHLRQLFWLCYTLDKEITLRTGLPPSIDDEHCDLSNLAEYWTMDRTRLDDPGLLAEAAVDEVLDPLHMRLTVLKSRTSRALYSAAALRKPDADLLRDIRELDDELEQWRTSVPPAYRPPLALSREDARLPLGRRLSASAAAERLNMQEIIIHFEYHYLMATIHRASGRCRSWCASPGTEGGGELAGVSSSQALSVQASRSTLFYLRAAIHSLSEMAFWMIVFYPMCAILSMFFNILLKPLDPLAEDDLELLKSVPGLIKDMRPRHLTPNEVVHMRMVDAFVAELTRLGHCAISKAGREAKVK